MRSVNVPRGAQVVRSARRPLMAPLATSICSDPLRPLMAEPLAALAVTIAMLTDDAIDVALATTAEPSADPARPRRRTASPSPARLGDRLRATHPLTSPHEQSLTAHGDDLGGGSRVDAQHTAATSVGASEPTSQRGSTAPASQTVDVGPPPVSHEDGTSSAVSPTMPSANPQALRSWTARAIAVGGATPVAAIANSPHEMTRPAQMSLRDDGSAPRDHGSSRPDPSAAHEVSRTGAAWSSDSTGSGTAPPVQEAHAPRSQLAGLARWWDEAHGPVEPADSVVTTAAPSVAIGDRTTREFDVSHGAGFEPTAGTEQSLRAVFGGLLEEVLLAEARADGVEVWP